MTDYSLARTRSAIFRSSSVDSRPTILLTRTYSVPDVTAYYRSSERYKPQWSSYYNYSYDYRPLYRYYRDNSLYDDYWYDRYMYFSPLYNRTLFPRRYYYSDYLPNPYYWSSPYRTYWTRYKSYFYDYGYPYTYRRYGDPYYELSLTSTYRPYRSYLLDNNYWLRSDYWNKRYNNNIHSYYWDNRSFYIPSYYNRHSKQYYTQWVQ